MSWKIDNIKETKSRVVVTLDKNGYKKRERFMKEDWSDTFDVDINGKKAEVEEWKKELMEIYGVEIV